MESIVRMAVNDSASKERNADREKGIGNAINTGNVGNAVNDGNAGNYGGRDGLSAKTASGEAKGVKKDGTGEPKKERKDLPGTADIAAERALYRKHRREYGLIAKYIVITVVVSYILLRVTDNAGTVLAAAGEAIKTAGILLRPLFWGFVLAYLLAPLVEICEKRLKKIKFFRRRLRTRAKLHTSAVVVTCLLALVCVSLILSVLVSAISRSLKVADINDLVNMAQSFAGTLDGFRQSILNWLNGMNISSAEVASALQTTGKRIATFTSGLSSGITGAAGQIGGILTGALFSVIFAIYFLLDGKGLRRYWNRVLLAVGGKKARRNLHILAMDADAVFSGYVRGQLIDALIMAFLFSASLSLIGVRYAVIIGVLSGIGNLIPYVGPLVAYGSTILVCLVSGDLRRLLVALVVLFVIQTVDGNIINPKLLSSNIDVHPMLVIAALLIGGSFGGLVGMLFAVPVAAFFKIQFDKIIDRLLFARIPQKKETESRKPVKKVRKAKKRSG